MSLQAVEGTSRLSPELKRTSAAPKAGRAPKAETLAEKIPGLDGEAATQLILASLEDDKAEEIVALDIKGKSSIADMLIVASGRSARHVGALADHLARKLKEAGAGHVRVEGLPHCDWVLVDAGDVIVHLFRPEVRSFYNIERIWAAPGPGSALPT